MPRLVPCAASRYRLHTIGRILTRYPSGCAGVSELVKRNYSYHLELDIVVNETELALLRALERHAQTSGSPVMLTARSLASEIKVSVATVRRSSNSLADKDLVVMSDTIRDDGGQGPNSYRVTSLGRELLRMDEYRTNELLRPVRIPAKGSAKDTSDTED